MEEVRPGIFKVEVPLPGTPLKSLNVYIIKGESKALLIDTGFHDPVCAQALYSALDELQIPISQLRLFLTHLHSDHSGLAPELNQSGVEVLMGATDGALFNYMTTEAYLDSLQGTVQRMDLVKDGLDFHLHPGYKYLPRHAIQYTALKEGDRVEIGPYRFKVIDIPGHTPGHIALYEQEARILISGDHILDPITPNIAFWGVEQDILQVYFDSLEKVRALEVDWVLTAHRRVIRNHRERIDILREHHRERLGEILEIIGEDWISVRDIASRMEWAIRAADWEGFPGPQKWFASSEALSHLEHLHATGRAERREMEGILFYRQSRT